MPVLAANLSFALSRHAAGMTIDIQPVEAGWSVTIADGASVVHVDPVEALRLALIEVAPE